MNDKEKLLMDYARMCKEDCEKCQIKQKCCDLSCNKWMMEHTKEAVEIIEKWGAEHPVKTRQDLFLEQFPDSTPKRICPELVDKINCGLRYFDGEFYGCDECRRDYWSQEVDHE